MINRHELARLVKGQLEDTTMKDIELILEVTCEEIIKATKRGEGVRIVNFATIEPSVRKAHIGADPINPGQKIEVPEVKTIRFRPCTMWKDVINND